MYIKNGMLVENEKAGTRKVIEVDYANSMVTLEHLRFKGRKQILSFSTLRNHWKEIT